jgi:hypothetical protein
MVRRAAAAGVSKINFVISFRDLIRIIVIIAPIEAGAPFTAMANRQNRNS